MKEGENKLDRAVRILVYVIGAAWFLTQLNFSFFNPINPMTIAPIFLSFSLAIQAVPRQQEAPLAAGV